MKHGSLFSGIGGFDLAAEWMGWENVFHCEWNEFGQKVLKHHFPKALSYADITKTDFNVHRGRISVLSGGFPCQPYSSAGKRLGKEDERHLWPEMLRAIREIQPRWVVGENVLGLVNWNGGMVFEEVQADLEAEGYEVQPFILPACAVNAPHVRQRVWFCAYSTNSDNELRQRRDGQGTPNRSTLKEKRTESLNVPRGWEEFPTQPPICSGDDGLSDRLDNITFPKWRNESIKAYGNAIVPQVAHQIFKAIEAYEQSLLH
jgi:DNA (cytosine-5)-methyltransferase 1